MKLPVHCNPLLGSDVFYYDVEARVFGDRLYFYGGYRPSDAESGDNSGLHVFSTADMIDFTDHGTVFTANDVSWTYTAGVWAPDCVCRNGIYYLYYALPDRRCGVAGSSSPTGPFTDIGQVQDVYGIDPSVLIDDDGKAWLYYGQNDDICCALLNDDMASIDTESITHPLSVKEHHYHEGVSIRKLGKKYVLVYTDSSRHGNIPMCQGWAVSDEPDRGYTYKGVLIDNFGCDPMTWNDHGSIACFRGEWYIFYHRALCLSDRLRFLAAEKLTPGPDGDFTEAPMSSNGIYPPIPAASEIPACAACGMRGSAYIDRCAASRYQWAVSRIGEGDGVTFSDLGFSGEREALISIKSDMAGRVELFADGRYIGFVPFAACALPALFRGAIEPVNGAAKLELRFFGYTEYDEKVWLKNAVMDEISFR